MRRAWIQAFLFLSLCAVPLQAQGQVSIESEVTPETGTVGDLFQLTITVRHPEGTALTFPEGVEELGDFEVRSFERLDPPVDQAPTMTRVRFTVGTFETGERSIGGVTVFYEKPGEEPGQMASDPIVIKIVSVLDEAATEIADIKPPVSLPRVWWEYWPWAIGALLLALIGWWLWKRWQRSQSETPQGAAPSRPAHEIALEALLELETSGLLERGELRPFFTGLSDILRRYLEGRFGVPAMESTTREVLDRFPSQVDESETTLRGLLELSDLVKFARQRPDTLTSQEALNRTRHWIESTIPAAPASSGPDNDHSPDTEEGHPPPLSAKVV